MHDNDAVFQANRRGAHRHFSGLTEARYGEDVNARDFDGQPHIDFRNGCAWLPILQVLGTMVDFESTKDVDPGALQDFRYKNPPKDKGVDRDVIEE